MQPAHPITIELRTGPAWIAAGLLLSTLALTVGVTWALLKGGHAWLLPPATAVLVGFCLWPLRSRPASRLRWDGHDWWLAPAVAGGRDDAEQRVVEMAVALDLGRHLLLRFVAAPRADRGAALQIRRHQWLAVSRSATAGDWHGLRCALHSPSPVGAEPAAADPPA